MKSKYKMRNKKPDKMPEKKIVESNVAIAEIHLNSEPEQVINTQVKQLDRFVAAEKKEHTEVNGSIQQQSQTLHHYNYSKHQSPEKISVKQQDVQNRTNYNSRQYNNIPETVNNTTVFDNQLPDSSLFVKDYSLPLKAEKHSYDKPMEAAKSISRQSETQSYEVPTKEQQSNEKNFSHKKLSSIADLPLKTEISEEPNRLSFSNNTEEFQPNSKLQQDNTKYNKRFLTETPQQYETSTHFNDVKPEISQPIQSDNSDRLQDTEFEYKQTEQFNETNASFKNIMPETSRSLNTSQYTQTSGFSKLHYTKSYVSGKNNKTSKDKRYIQPLATENLNIENIPLTNTKNHESQSGFTETVMDKVQLQPDFQPVQYEDNHSKLNFTPVEHINGNRKPTHNKTNTHFTFLETPKTDNTTVANTIKTEKLFADTPDITQPVKTSTQDYIKNDIKNDIKTENIQPHMNLQHSNLYEKSDKLKFTAAEQDKGNPKTPQTEIEKQFVDVTDTSYPLKSFSSDEIKHENTYSPMDSSSYVKIREPPEKLKFTAGNQRNANQKRTHRKNDISSQTDNQPVSEYTKTEKLSYNSPDITITEPGKTVAYADIKTEKAQIQPDLQSAKHYEKSDKLKFNSIEQSKVNQETVFTNNISVEKAFVDVPDIKEPVKKFTFEGIKQETSEIQINSNYRKPRENSDKLKFTSNKLNTDEPKQPSIKKNKQPAVFKSPENENKIIFEESKGKTPEASQAETDSNHTKPREKPYKPIFTAHTQGENNQELSGKKNEYQAIFKSSQHNEKHVLKKKTVDTTNIKQQVKKYASNETKKETIQNLTDLSHIKTHDKPDKLKFADNEKHNDSSKNNQQQTIFETPDTNKKSFSNSTKTKKQTAKKIASNIIKQETLPTVTDSSHIEQPEKHDKVKFTIINEQVSKNQQSTNLKKFQTDKKSSFKDTKTKKLLIGTPDIKQAVKESVSNSTKHETKQNKAALSSTKLDEKTDTLKHGNEKQKLSIGKNNEQPTNFKKLQTNKKYVTDGKRIKKPPVYISEIKQTVKKSQFNELKQETTQSKTDSTCIKPDKKTDKLKFTTNENQNNNRKSLTERNNEQPAVLKKPETDNKPILGDTKAKEPLVTTPNTKQSVKSKVFSETKPEIIQIKKDSSNTKLHEKTDNLKFTDNELNKENQKTLPVKNNVQSTGLKKQLTDTPPVSTIDIKKPKKDTAFSETKPETIQIKKDSSNTKLHEKTDKLKFTDNELSKGNQKTLPVKNNVQSTGLKKQLTDTPPVNAPDIKKIEKETAFSKLESETIQIKKDSGNTKLHEKTDKLKFTDIELNKENPKSLPVKNNVQSSGLKKQLTDKPPVSFPDIKKPIQETSLSEIKPETIQIKKGLSHTKTDENHGKLKYTIKEQNKDKQELSNGKNNIIQPMALNTLQTDNKPVSKYKKTKEPSIDTSAEKHALKIETKPEVLASLQNNEKAILNDTKKKSPVNNFDIKQPIKSASNDIKQENRQSKKDSSTIKSEEKPRKLKFTDSEQSINNQTSLTFNTKVQYSVTLNTKDTDIPSSGSSETDTKKNDSEKSKLPSQNATEPVKKPEKASKLQFSKEEKPPGDAPPPNKKLSKLKGKADKYNSKLEKARDKLPSIKHEVKERIFDEEKGKVKKKLRYEKEILPPGTTKPAAPVPIALAKKGIGGISRIGINKLHHKIYEVEDENVGVKAAHRTELAAEGLYREGKRVTRSAYSFVKNRPYRTVAKLEKKAAKANIKYSYRKVLEENPQLKKKALSRFIQKKRIKRQYAKTLREAKRTGSGIKKVGNLTVNVTKVFVQAIRNNPTTIGMIAIMIMLIFFIFTMFSSCTNMINGSLSAIFISSYSADDADIDKAELFYTELETDLQIKINKAEQTHPGYDEYRYQVGDIGHNPYELMAFLTAVYEDFEYSGIRADLQQIFNEQYQLTFTEIVEIRYRTETRTNARGEEYEVEVPYEWYILKITLTSRSFTNVVSSYMDSEQLEIYSLHLQMKGNRQYITSPFDFNWLTHVTSYYGYRVHPVSGAKDYHKGVDIGVSVGTDIHAGHDGKVTFAGYNGDYGYVVTIEDNKGLVSKYAHCNSLLVSAGQEVKAGDVIAKSGNSGNSTGPHLHLEVIKNGVYLNPIYFAETNDDGLSEPEYGYAGSPMGDGSYTALIAEAEKYLGYPYVFGGSSPSTSFDCSGFVCWVFKQSGVANVSRTTAQGLYNLSTPVSPSNAKPGDLIFFHSTYSTPNTVTHVGIYVGGDWMLHCGSPIQYTSINTSYWQNHFYAYGRLS